MKRPRALVYADRLFTTTDGKTAHGLVRYCQRYQITSVVDTTLPPSDAGQILDHKPNGIPVYPSLETAIQQTKPDTFIIGAVSEGGVLPQGYEHAVEQALHHGLNIVSGLHEFISDKPHLASLAKQHNCTITDIRKIYRDHKRFYTGDIKNVPAIRIALLGTDSAIGKRTMAVVLVNELRKRGHTADMIFTGQTGWMQGWKHGIVLDALINDFISGGIEGAILDSWNDDHPQFILIEGQGSLVHPFFPGGFEILAAGRVHGFLLMDAPGRPNLDGFPDYPMPDPQRVIKIAELLTEKPLLGIGLSHEHLTPTQMQSHQKRYHDRFHVPVADPLSGDVTNIIDTLETLIEKVI
jgi:uncharacterized NAD-dependent epimerase/dehydratase family protein